MLSRCTEGALESRDYVYLVIRRLRSNTFLRPEQGRPVVRAGSSLETPSLPSWHLLSLASLANSYLAFSSHHHHRQDRHLSVKEMRVSCRSRRQSCHSCVFIGLSDLTLWLRIGHVLVTRPQEHVSLYSYRCYHHLSSHSHLFRVRAAQRRSKARVGG